MEKLDTIRVGMTIFPEHGDPTGIALKGPCGRRIFFPRDGDGGESLPEGILGTRTGNILLALRGPCCDIPGCIIN